MKEVRVLVICLLLIFVVSGEEDLTCKAGEGVFDYSKRASGTCGIFKITTMQECKVAAEYNIKN